MLKHIFTLLCLLPLAVLGQYNTDYQGLLWKISGNGLEKPSYLYGTMHVSNRVAFHLSETFFEALEQSDVIALETNPEEWIRDMTETELFEDVYAMSYPNIKAYYPLYNSFKIAPPLQPQLGYLLAHEQNMLNGLLWRFNQGAQDFEENTFLDLFIYQAGKKTGKKIVALEDFEGSFLSVMRSSKPDEDAQQSSERQLKALLGDFETWTEVQEDAYRKGDLDRLDTLTSLLYPSKYYRKNMLDIRNEVMAVGMDSIMQSKSLFTGVGAAHLPGKMGVINLLRKMGYTVEAQARSITMQSMGQKEKIDKLVYTHPIQDFKTPDGFIQTKAPGKMVKVVSTPYSEYLFADMANSAFYTIKRINTFAPLFGKDIKHYKARLDSLLFENIPGKITSNTPIKLSGYDGLEIKNITKKGDEQRYKILFTPLEVIIAKVGGHKTFVQSKQAELFFDNLVLKPKAKDETVYSPSFKSFKVALPPYNRVENYEGAYYNPYNTFRAQALDKENHYYSVAYRQFYDFQYLEDDNFELHYAVEQLEEDKKISIDTLYRLKNSSSPSLYFKAHGIEGEDIYGRMHLQGPKYAMLMTDAPSKSAQDSFFDSFQFVNYNYTDDFTLRKDSTLYIQMKSPKRLGDYSALVERSYGGYNRGGKEGQNNHLQKTKEKLFIYKPTGEILKLGYIKLHKYRSYDNMKEYWQDGTWDGLEKEKEEVISKEERDTSYYKEVRIVWLKDTIAETQNRIVKKMIVENGMVYYLMAYTNPNHSSKLVKMCFNI